MLGKILGKDKKLCKKHENYFKHLRSKQTNTQLRIARGGESRFRYTFLDAMKYAEKETGENLSRETVVSMLWELDLGP